MKLLLVKECLPNIFYLMLHCSLYVMNFKNLDWLNQL